MLGWDLIKLAETQAVGSLFRRSFDFAQDDRRGCDDRLGGMTGLCAIQSSYSAVIPTGVEGSHQVGRDSGRGFPVQEVLRLRSG